MKGSLALSENAVKTNSNRRKSLSPAPEGSGRPSPLVHGASRGFYGQITTVRPGKTACLRCLFPESPDCARPSVLGPTCGVVGCLQATEVIKLILGIGSLLENRLLLFDGLRGTSEELEAKRKSGCLTERAFTSSSISSVIRPSAASRSFRRKKNSTLTRSS